MNNTVFVPQYAPSIQGPVHMVALRISGMLGLMANHYFKCKQPDKVAEVDKLLQKEEVEKLDHRDDVYRWTMKALELIEKHARYHIIAQYDGLNMKVWIEENPNV